MDDKPVYIMKNLKWCMLIAVFFLMSTVPSAFGHQADGRPKTIVLSTISNEQTHELERMGYHVTPRTSSIEALNTFKANPDTFDLVITDMTMPKMTGVRLIHEIKAVRADIPGDPCFRSQNVSPNISRVEFALDASYRTCRFNHLPQVGCSEADEVNSAHLEGEN